MRNKISLNESQLHKVIKESVKRVLSEAFENWTPEQWASLAGQAQGSQKTGMSALWNQNYNARKARQALKFANIAAQGRIDPVKGYGNRINQNNYSTYWNNGMSGYKHNGGNPALNFDYFDKHNNDKDANPFQIRQFQHDGASSDRIGPEQGKRYNNSQDFKNADGYRDKYIGGEVTYGDDGSAELGTHRMNMAFNRGVAAAKGKPLTSYNGETYGKDYYFRK